jgi:hypothetical protein
MKYIELVKQEYAGNHCKISAGFVEGEDKPDIDTIFVKLEKDGVEPTIIILTPDEAQALSWVTTGAVWSHLYNLRQEDKNEA